MNKSLDEILREVTPDTKIEVVAGYCDTVDDLMEIISCVPEKDNNTIPTFDDLQKLEKYLAKYEVDKTNTANIQAILRVPYTQAQRIADLFQNQEMITKKTVENV